MDETVLIAVVGARGVGITKFIKSFCLQNFDFKEDNEQEEHLRLYVSHGTEVSIDNQQYFIAIRDYGGSINMSQEKWKFPKPNVMLTFDVTEFRTFECLPQKKTAIVLSKNIQIKSKK